MTDSRYHRQREAARAHPNRKTDQPHHDTERPYPEVAGQIEGAIKRFKSGTKTAVYLRQSLDRNNDENAISRQREGCLKLCKERGWDDTTEYPDNAKSASTGKARPAYQRLLRDIRAGKIRAVVVWDLDRLHRRPIELEEFIDLADEHRLALATVTGDVDLGTHNGRLYARIKGAVARAEVDQKSARQKAANEQIAGTGRAWWTVRPFGYDADPHPVTGKWTTGSKERPVQIRLHPTEAPLLAEAYERVHQGSALETIAKEWNARGLSGPKGGKWTGANLGPLLTRARNAGLREYRGKVVGPGDWPAIVTEDLWRAVTHILSDPARRTRLSWGRKHLMTNIAACSECGDGLGSGRVGSGQINYLCKSCFKVSRNAARLDALVVEAVVQRLSQPDALELIADRERPDREELSTQRKALREQQKALGDAHADGQLSLAAFLAADKGLTRRIEAISDQLTDHGRAEIYDGVIGADDVYAAFTGLDLDRRRAIVSTLVSVTVHPSGRGRSFRREDIDIQFHGKR